MSIVVEATTEAEFKLLSPLQWLFLGVCLYLSNSLVCLNCRSEPINVA